MAASWTKVGSVRGPSGATFVCALTLAETMAVALQAGIRTRKGLAAPGVLPLDRLVVVPTALPDGFAIVNVAPTAKDTVTVALATPVLAIGASYSIPCALYALGRS